jgi:hypothetical protein
MNDNPITKGENSKKLSPSEIALLVFSLVAFIIRDYFSKPLGISLLLLVAGILLFPIIGEIKRHRELSLRKKAFLSALILALYSLLFIWIFDFKIKFLDDMFHYAMRKFPAVTTFIIGLLSLIRLKVAIRRYKETGDNSHIGWAVFFSFTGALMLYGSFLYMIGYF